MNSIKRYLRDRSLCATLLLGATLFSTACPPPATVRPNPPLAAVCPSPPPPPVCPTPPTPTEPTPPTPPGPTRLPSGPQESMRPISPSAVPMLDDDLPLEPLLAAVEAEVKFLEHNPRTPTLTFGPHTIPKSEHLKSLRRFLELGRTLKNKRSFLDAVQKEFAFYEVFGQRDWGDAFITSYYAPVIRGSRRPTPQFSVPMYRRPSDLVSLDLTTFDKRLNLVRKLRGRVVNQSLVPYYTREEIDERGILRGRNLEICWVDPLDAYTFHTEGSGEVQLDDGTTLHLVFADKNGHTYEKIVKYLHLTVPPEQMNYYTIERALRSLPVAEMRKILAKNPSYVFFEQSQETADTWLGVAATDGRTIATDARFLPKGALAFIIAQKPKFASDEAGHAVSWEPMSRFVLDQDTGGAILGGGRVDLFWGHGADAKRHADVFKQQGKLYYLLLKSAVPQAAGPSRATP